jgi:hypothetical protein
MSASPTPALPSPTPVSARTEQEQLTGLGISVSGLGGEAIARIEEIGFDAWLDEAVDTAPVKKPAIGLSATKPVTARPVRRLLCEKCGSVFLSHTRATKLCPDCGGATDIPQRDGKQLRACASGDKCLRVGKRNLPAPAAPGKQFCSEACHGGHVARLARLKT